MKPQIAIYHRDDHWRAECPLIPEIDCEAPTLSVLLHTMLRNVDHVVESAIATASMMRIAVHPDDHQ